MSQVHYINCKENPFLPSLKECPIEEDGCELRKLPFGYISRLLDLRVWKQMTNPKNINKEQN